MCIYLPFEVNFKKAGICIYTEGDKAVTPFNRGRRESECPEGKGSYLTQFPIRRIVPGAWWALSERSRGWTWSTILWANHRKRSLHLGFKHVRWVSNGAACMVFREVHFTRPGGHSQGASWSYRREWNHWRRGQGEKLFACGVNTRRRRGHRLTEGVPGTCAQPSREDQWSTEPK